MKNDKKDKKDNKKQIVKFLTDTKLEAKKSKIPYNMRMESYTNKKVSIYTYGIR